MDDYSLPSQPRYRVRRPGRVLDLQTVRMGGRSRQPCEAPPLKQTLEYQLRGGGRSALSRRSTPAQCCERHSPIAEGTARHTLLRTAQTLRMQCMRAGRSYAFPLAAQAQKRLQRHHTGRRHLPENKIYAITKFFLKDLFISGMCVALGYVIYVGTVHSR